MRIFYIRLSVWGGGEVKKVYGKRKFLTSGTRIVKFRRPPTHPVPHLFYFSRQNSLVRPFIVQTMGFEYFWVAMADEIQEVFECFSPPPRFPLRRIYSQITRNFFFFFLRSSRPPPPPVNAWFFFGPRSGSFVPLNPIFLENTTFRVILRKVLSIF